MKKNWQTFGKKVIKKKKIFYYYKGYRQLFSIYYDNIRTVNKD